MKPVAWAIFAENGNIRMWSPTNEAVEKLAEREGLTVTPLYAATGIMYLVCAQWEFEGNADLIAFFDEEKARAFAAECEVYQETEPDDDYDSEWEDKHPAKPYVSVGDTIYGVESFVVIEVKML